MSTLADKTEHWLRHNRSAALAALLLSAAYTLCMNWFRDYQYGVFRVLLGAAVVFVLLVYAPRALAKRRPRQLWPLALFGLIEAFFMVAMRTAVAQGGGVWQLWLWGPFLVFALTYTLCAAGLVVLIERFGLLRTGAARPLKRLWLWLFLALLVAWAPYFATYGPVRISPDSYDVISQALGQSTLSDSHPVAYTLWVALFLRGGAAAGSIMTGAYLLGFAQLCGMAAALSYTVVWLRRFGCPALVWGASLALYGLSPIFAINAITLWKDIPFNILLLILMLKLAELAKSRGTGLDSVPHLIGFIALSAGICFARGNGFALMCAVCALIFLCWPRRHKRWLAVFVPMLLCIALVRGPLFSALGIGRLGSVEAAAMPLQQVSRVIVDGGTLTSAQREVIERFVPLEVIEENYVPTTPDGVKKHPQFDTEAFSDNSGDFMAVWLQLAPANAERYLNSWLTQTLGYWKYDFDSVPVYLAEDFSGSFGIEYKDLMRWATGADFYNFFGSRTGYPSMGLMAQATLLAGALLLVQKRGRMALALAPPLVVWVGLMAGAPTYNDFRYMMVSALALPVILWLPCAVAGPPAAVAKAPKPAAAPAENG